MKSVKCCGFALLFAVCAVGTNTRKSGCDPGTMVVYRMSLETHWTEELFPKSYPKWRPPAQWSQVFGQVHNKYHRIFSIGNVSSTAVKNFAERGDYYRLSKPIMKKGIFDQFLSKAILKGDGNTTKDIFTMGDFSKVSLLCKIIPSPDWFIGIDSFDLCDNGEWTESVEVSVDPLDAGTQGGLTFTAPRWRLQVPSPIERITSSRPSHRAASFHYEDMKKLPTIATFRFEKIKEFPLDYNVSEQNVIFFEEYNDTFSEYDGFLNDTTEIRLTSEAEQIASNVTEKFKKNDKYFPKLFRPKIDESALIRDKKKSYNSYTSGNLLKSRLPPRRRNSSVLLHHFRW